jgi:ribosomal protein L17
MALRSRPVALRRIANKLLDKAEQGDLAAAREVIDRTDGKAIQATDYGDLSPRRLTDEQLEAIAAGALTEKDLLALPPPPEFSDSK